MVGGVFLFTTSNYRLDLRHTNLLMKFMRRPRSLVQPVQAHLYEGLTCFVNESQFFGSPYLLQGWIEGHFKGIALGPAPGVRPHVPRSVKKTLLGWRHFNTLANDDIIWDMTNTTTYVTRKNEERELLLIGASSYVTYPISRCSHVLGTFRIPPLVSFYYRVEHRDLGSSGDMLHLREILLNWEYNGLDQPKMMIGSGDEVEYFKWLLPKLLPNGLSAEEHEAKQRKEGEDRLCGASSTPT